MGQTWTDLLFMHWRVDPADLDGVVPPQLPLDLRDGNAWIGVTPFRVEGLRLRGTLPPPLVSSFLEVNARTYVTYEGRPGIYFLSLDATSRLAVAAARRAYRLPYFHAEADLDAPGGDLRYRARRLSPDGPPAALDVTYRSTGEPLPVREGSIERWLAERYCLYTLDDEQNVLRGEIHHPPWPLCPADGTVRANSMTDAYGMELEGEPLMHYSARQDVVLWQIESRGRIETP
jgi:uncharacterized protein YqjF (DUF2071 family)